jgi:hypothetical protein
MRGIIPRANNQRIRSLLNKIIYTNILKGTNLHFREMIQQLPEQFAARVSRHHARPNSFTLGEEETYSLANSFPSTVLLEAFTRAGTYTKQHPHAERAVILKVLHSIASRLLSESHARGKHTNFSGMASQTQSVQHHNTKENDVEELQRIFATEVGGKTLETFTLHAYECEALLAERSLNELSALCGTTGNWVWAERTDRLHFHDQDTVVAELFKRARIPQPQMEIQQ